MKTGKVVIPARMESERLPRKMMIDILGRPMIEHVWRRARLVLSNEDVVIATDSDQIASHMQSIGAQVHKSKKDHLTGSSRVSEYVNETKLDFAIILQGDEVLIRPSVIEDLFDAMSRSSASFINTVSPLQEAVDLEEQDIVKCWVDSTNRIRFVFRGNPLRSPDSGFGFLNIINGLFGISGDALRIISQDFQGIAKSESIEQLAALDRGIDIFAHQVSSYYPSVNTYQELQDAIGILESDGEQKLILKAFS